MPSPAAADGHRSAADSPSSRPTPTPLSPSFFSQPRPRPSRSPQAAERIRVRNRRLEYLRRHPDYLTSSDREFADVALYDSLIRAFQTPAERAAEAREKGFGQVLEASILRNPEHLQRIDDDDVVEEEEEEEEEGEGEEETKRDGGKDGEVIRVNGVNGTHNTNGHVPPTAERIGGGGGGDADLDLLEFDAVADAGEIPLDDPFNDPLDAAAVARRRWHAFLRAWFVRGGARDDGFDYPAVDDDSDYDGAWVRTDAQEAWFDTESPAWASDNDEAGGGARRPTGETGIQDY
ncbi:hypothetical protein SPI_03669 [Niveomyces insectorum RCEF 264]|uniref:CCD97-like C-terminal domain-containing protein n=1 Tax=Niveomyces insectorum RCEF 264 TaxID=1081102 RepID=A0A167W9L6_9HYPO|nr:hypothetical protein SPI_03669 [Niveomyces insectorum RCEF 264]